MTAAVVILSAIVGALIIAVFVLWGRIERQAAAHNTLVSETRQAFNGWAAAFETSGPEIVAIPSNTVRVPDEAPEPS